MKTKGKNLVAVAPELKKHAGTVTMWRLHGDVTHKALEDAWKAHGFNTSDLPELPSPEVALRRAIGHLSSKRTLVRSLAKRGAWAIVIEQVMKDGETLKHEQSFNVSVNKIGNLVFKPEEVDAKDFITDSYRKELFIHDSTALSEFLVSQVTRLRAVGIQNKGGVYFIPQEHVEVWERMNAALEESGAALFTNIPAMPTDSVVRSVLSALKEEVVASIKAIEDDMASGIKEEALNNRVDRCVTMVNKIASYEELFNVKLDEIRRATEDLKANISSAILTVGSGADEC
jgi:hypothetical protein